MKGKNVIRRMEDQWTFSSMTMVMNTTIHIELCYIIRIYDLSESLIVINRLHFTDVQDSS